MQRRRRRDPFLEQGLNGPYPGVPVKTTPDRIALEEIGQRQETHALMMGHVGLNDHPPLALTTRWPAEVYRFVVAIILKQPQAGQSFQILHRLSRRQAYGQQGGIGRHDDLFLQTALQSQLRNAKSLVLVGLVEVQIAVGRLRDPPGHLSPPTIGHLDRHRFPGRFIQEGVSQGVLKNQRHQIFEHRPGPAQQHPAPTDQAVGSTQGKPVFHGHITPGDGDKTPQPRLTRQEVIVGAVQAAFGNVEADGEQPPFGVI